MNRFTRLFTDLDRTNRTAAKIDAVRAYFAGEGPASPPDPPHPRDAAWALALLCGHRLKRVIKTGVMERAVCRAAAVEPWMVHECLEAVGDFSETAALLISAARASDLNASENTPTRDTPLAGPPLHEVIESWIRPLARSTDDHACEQLLECWQRLPDHQLLVFNKLVRGGFRLGVQRRLVVRGLSRATAIDAALLEHRLTGTFTPTAAGYAAVVRPAGDRSSPTAATPEADREDAARAYPFCLAQQLTGETDALGPPADWQVEWKYDGIRAQLVHRHGLPHAELWSRGEEVISSVFPEIVAAARGLLGDCVLDGEVLAWDPRHAGGRARSFNALQTRLNRKRIQPGLFDADRVVFMAFDLLEADGADARATPLRDRRRSLEARLSSARILDEGVLLLSPLLDCSSWEQARDLRARARDLASAEGLMLKHRASAYHSGRRAGVLGVPGHPADDDPDDPDIADDPPPSQPQDLAAPAAVTGWWKWKLDPYAVDAVLVYAQPGSGRRAGLYTDYTFALWSGHAPGEGELTPFAKAYSGLDNDEIRRVDAFVRANTTARSGPLRTVTPALVFEIAFEGARLSPRHRSGLAVRFPRILRWRADKHPADADTLDAVRRLISP